jgi:Glycosyltransferase family 87
VSDAGDAARFALSRNARATPGWSVVTGPHAILGAIASTALVAELAAQETGSSVWMMLAAAVAASGFVAVWRRQDELRLLPLLALTLAFHLAWIVLHLILDVTSFDSTQLYRGWGNELLDGRYPESQYPPGAVLLFALDAWLGDGATRTSHAFVMVPFQLVTVTAVWAFRTRVTPWLAALVALWPLNAFFWEFRFDLVPTALLAVGLLAAFRERWALSGAMLGIGAAVKWVPGVAFAVLAVWLLASGRRVALARHVGAFTAVFVFIHLPFVLWSPDAATYAYRYFSDQGMTGESVWYLLLAPFGLATVDAKAFWLPADVPAWADPAAIAVQGLAMLLVVAVTVSARASLRAGVSLAALAPTVFLLTNRVFSPQYLVLMLAAWAIAGAVLLEDRRQQLALGGLAIAATTANAFVYPYTLFEHSLWRAASVALFLTAAAATGWLVLRAVAEGRRPTGDERHLGIEQRARWRSIEST